MTLCDALKSVHHDSLMFAPNGEIDLFFTSQQQHPQQASNSTKNHPLPPESLLARATTPSPTPTTPRTATPAGDSSPRHSEGFEAVSSVDEHTMLDQEFQMLLRCVAENVAELALSPFDDQMLLQQHHQHHHQHQQKQPMNAHKPSPFRDMFLPMNATTTTTPTTLTTPTTTAAVASIGSSSKSPFALSVLGGNEFDSLKFANFPTSNPIPSSKDHFDEFSSPLLLRQQQQQQQHQQLQLQLQQQQLQQQQQQQQPQQPQVRPDWQKICIQHSICIHNIYGNCAYGVNCYYYHLDGFHKPDLLFKTELCRYGMDCANRARCCFAHNKKERRTPEQNVREALSKVRLPPALPPQSRVIAAAAAAAAAASGNGNGNHGTGNHGSVGVASALSLQHQHQLHVQQLHVRSQLSSMTGGVGNNSNTNNSSQLHAMVSDLSAALSPQFQFAFQ